MAAFLRLIPFLVVIISGLAIYQLYGAVMFATRGDWGMMALYGLLAVAGFVLAWTLWSNRRKLLAPRQ
jgi:hypothetical protein